MSFSEQLNVWEYFEKILTDNPYNKKAKCMVCSNVYSYASTSHNLKAHIIKVHPESIGLTKTTKKKISVLWDYFTKTGEANGVAVCNLCSKELSSNHESNLKSHLQRIHAEAYHRLSENIPLDALEVDEDDTYYLEYEDEAHQNEEDADGSDAPSTDVWSYFSSEAGGRARCVICKRLFRYPKYLMLRNHIRDDHPKLFLELPDISDNENADNEYTEVVYLEDETMNKILQSATEEEQNKTRSKYARTKRVDSCQDENPAKKRKKHSAVDCCSSNDEIAQFGSYVTCLLRSLPSDVTTRLQRNIINMIMNAKLSQTETSVAKVSERTQEFTDSAKDANNSQITSNVADNVVSD